MNLSNKNTPEYKFIRSAEKHLDSMSFNPGLMRSMMINHINLDLSDRWLLTIFHTIAGWDNWYGLYTPVPDHVLEFGRFAMNGVREGLPNAKYLYLPHELLNLDNDL